LKKHKRIPDHELKKWSNVVLRKQIRRIEADLIECQEKKERLHKNANNVYQKYKDKLEESEELIGELNDKIIDLEDALK